MPAPLSPLSSPSAWALLGYAGWALVLVTAILFHRSAVVMTGGRRANAWPRGETPSGEPALMVRIRDAHLNTVEHMPMFIAVVVVAFMLGRLPVVDPLAPYLLAARIFQSVVHLLGTSHTLVFLRANFFVVQLALLGYMILNLLR